MCVYVYADTYICLEVIYITYNISMFMYVVFQWRYIYIYISDVYLSYIYKLPYIHKM